MTSVSNLESSNYIKAEKQTLDSEGETWDSRQLEPRPGTSFTEEATMTIHDLPEDADDMSKQQTCG